jgi:hypothetical protein
MFEVKSLHVSLSKGDSYDSEKPLGDLLLTQFSLLFDLSKFNMNVGVKLAYGGLFPS